MQNLTTIQILLVLNLNYYDKRKGMRSQYGAGVHLEFEEPESDPVLAGAKRSLFAHHTIDIGHFSINYYLCPTAHNFCKHPRSKSQHT